MGRANTRNPDGLTDPACATIGANFREPGRKFRPRPDPRQ
jgi:hypothetical protein